jgi:hypothetical protein
VDKKKKKDSLLKIVKDLAETDNKIGLVDHLELVDRARRYLASRKGSK